jgi:probable HAF family extracellular repeat protein
MRLPLAIVLLGGAFGCVGCSCADDGLPSAAGGVVEAPVYPMALSAPCTPGLALGAGYARITEIPSRDGKQVFVQDINDDGVAVGAQMTAEGKYRAFRHTEAGGVQDLGAQAEFGGESFASAIAPDGAIGGHSAALDTGVLASFRYTASGGRREICPGGCSVWDLNGKGQAVGLVRGRDTATWQAFVFSPVEGLRTLGTLGGARSSASGISERGVVVGNAQLAGSAEGDLGHAFIYDPGATEPGKTMRDLNALARTPGWVLEAANDVNDRFVVGYGLHDGRKRGFRLDLEGGEIVDLGTVRGGGDSFGWAVDAYGDAVGWAVGSDGKNAAFVYAAGLGGVRKLGDLVDPAAGWTLVQANGINDRGQIVGWGYRNGAPRGFKLTVPYCPVH